MVDTRKQSEGAMHPAVAEPQPFKNSGKDVHSLNPPIVTVEPQSGVGKVDQQKPEIERFDGLDDLLFGSDNFIEDYPYHDLEAGHGFFIKTPPGKTTDNLLATIRKSLDNINKHYAVIEVDADGNEIWDQCTVKVRKRNEDGTIQLEDGKPIEGANFTHIPRYHYTRHFVARSFVNGAKIVGDKKAPGDGVMIMRVT